MGTVHSFKVTGVYDSINGQVIQTTSFYSITIATVLVALLPLIPIFFYKNRKKQIVLSYLTIVFIIAYGAWLAQNAKKMIGDVKLDVENYGIGILLPSIAIIFIILATKGIRNDEKLIKSSERLR